MKDLIKEALQTKFGGILKKVSPRVIEVIVDQLASKITEEGEIQNTIDGLDEMVIPFSKYVETLEAEADRRVRQVRDKLKTEFEFVPKNKPETKELEKQDGPTENQQLNIQELVSKQVAEALRPVREFTTRTNLREKFKTAGIPESLVDDVQITDDFNEAEVVEKAKQKWADTQKLVINLAVDSGQVYKGDQKAPGATIQAIKDYGKSKDIKANAGYNIQENI